jgi:thioredoxin 1
MAWQNLSAANWEESLFQAPTILFFYTDWCELCLVARDILQSLQAEAGDRVRFCQIDFDTCDEIAERYSVFGIPTVLALTGGTVIETRPGLRDEAQYRAMVKALMNMNCEL